MPLQHDNGYDFAISSHEERLQKVEDTLQEVVVQVGKVETKLDAIPQSIRDGFASVNSSLDRFHEKVDKLSADGDAMADRLRPLEEQRAAVQERRGAMKSIILGTLLAAAGALATKGGEFIWEFLARK